ncbi:MAG: Aminotransferase [Patescibacteria group bacterium]|nr:Aminotransferase [Patescibacteria group bacterium]
MIAKRIAQFDSSHIRKAFSRVREIPDPIDLSIGFPEDATPDYIKAAGIRAISQDFTRYTPSNGIFELRAAIAEKLTRENKIKVTPDLVTVTPGVTTGILLSYLALLDPGDEVLIPDPYFPPYFDLARMLGAVPVAIDTYPSFQLTARLVEQHITPKTKVLLINSPNNPSGAVYPERELRRIARMAKEHNITILSDEIYEYFSYNTPHFSIGSVYKNTVTLNGFSKAYAMTGWRVGYLAGPEEFIQAVNQLQQYVVFSNSSIAEKAALAALSHSPQRLIKKYRAKRDMVLRYLEPMFDIYGSHGAFYAFVQLPSGMTDLEFCEEAAKRSLIVLPSRAFSKRQDYIRIAFATKHTTLVKGLKILRTMMKEFAE